MVPIGFLKDPDVKAEFAVVSSVRSSSRAVGVLE
jgi:hypothetical protein